jgi:nucleoside-diphosphate-sugar epimerase
MRVYKPGGAQYSEYMFMSKQTDNGKPVTYLITGATGDVGSRVVRQLVQRGIRPRVFVRDAQNARSRFADSVEIAVGDLADQQALKAACSRG